MPAHARTAAAVPELSPPPCRLRKHVMAFPAPTVADAAALVEGACQRERVLRWATTARVLEELGQPCDSLTELARVTELADPPAPEGDAQQRALVQLCALVGLTAAVCARIGTAAQASELRALCFELARTCQHAQSRLRKQQLWGGA